MEKEYIEIIKNGGVGVIPTDTLYGVVGLASTPETVERIYKIKGRDSSKPFIILISSIEDLKNFGIKISKEAQKVVAKYWPGKVSIIFDRKDKKFEYLTRGSESLAFRMPDKKDLLEFLVKTGPLVAPSANKEGRPPAQTIEEAKGEFGDLVDFYIDGGTAENDPSTLIKVENGNIVVLRKGAVEIDSKI